MVTRLGVGSPGVGVTVWCLGLGFSGACVQKSAFNRTLSNTRQHGGACVERKLSKCGCVQISIPASNRFDGSAAAAAMMIIMSGGCRVRGAMKLRERIY